MKTTSEALLSDLMERTKKNMEEAQKLREQPVGVLNYRPAAGGWSILECLEHLNLYGDFYLPAIKKSLQQATTPAEAEFRAGRLGNYFANMMLPKEKHYRMKTFKDKDPMGSSLDRAVLSRFIQQQEEMLQLLEQAGQVSLNKTKTPISISKWIRLRLGDTFRVVIYHNQRHLVQAQKLLKTD